MQMYTVVQFSQKEMSMPFTGKQIVLEMNMLGGVRQNHKEKYYTFFHMYIIYIQNILQYIRNREAIQKSKLARIALTHI